MTNCNNNTLQCENDQPRAETQVKLPSAHNINLNVCPPDVAVDSLVHGLILTTPNPQLLHSKHLEVYTKHIHSPKQRLCDDDHSY